MCLGRCSAVQCLRRSRLVAPPRTRRFSDETLCSRPIRSLQSILSDFIRWDRLGDENFKRPDTPPQHPSVPSRCITLSYRTYFFSIFVHRYELLPRRIRKKKKTISVLTARTAETVRNTISVRWIPKIIGEPIVRCYWLRP